jgi:hypothetical protein
MPETTKEPPKIILPPSAEKKRAPAPEPDTVSEIPMRVCTKCGATRPQVEVDHKACANCADLESRREILKNQDAMKKAQEAELSKLQETLKVLPLLDKPMSSLYDNERGVVWLGIDLKSDKNDPVSLMLAIDQAKVHILLYLADWKKRKSKIVVVKEAIGGMMSRLGEQAKGVLGRK